MSAKSVGLMNMALVTGNRIPHRSAAVPFLLSWSQKAGCTTLLKWFFYHANLLDEALDYVSGEVGLNIHLYERKIFRGRDGYLEDVASDLKSGKPVLNFVRCPYQRVFSSYMQLCNRFFLGQEKKGIPSPGLLLRRSILDSTYGVNVALDYPLSFHDYLEWMADQDMSNIDPHHTPQSSEIYRYSNISHFRLDDFDQVTSMLEREYGLRSSDSDERIHSSGHHNPKVELPAAAAIQLLEKSIPLVRSENFKVPKITEELLRGTRMDYLIRTIFQEDVDLYSSLSSIAIKTSK